MSIVVDASVITAVVVADGRQDAARAHLQDWLATGEGLHAPAVLPYEIANVLARLVFDGALEISEVNDIWTDLAALGLVLHPFDLIQDGQQVAAITAPPTARHRLGLRLPRATARDSRVDLGRRVGAQCC